MPMSSTGLSDHLRWIDNGRMRMTDADLPEVMAIRHESPPSEITGINSPCSGCCVDLP
jgi:hypothetical protein